MLSAFGAVAQTPTKVQAVYCPNSGVAGSGTGGSQTNGVYICPFAEPTLSHNFISVNLFYAPASSPQTLTVSDSAGNTYTQDVTSTTANSNTQQIYHLANAAAGITYVKLSFSGGSTSTGFVNVIISEWYNVAASSPLDVASCNSATSTSVTAGSMTIGTSGDLVVQHVFSDNSASATSFAVGSQFTTNLFAASDLNDGAALEYGTYSSTGSLNATFSQVPGHPFASCAAAFKPESSGTAPSGNRIQMVSHAQAGVGASSTFRLQVPMSGNLFVISALNGDDVITGLSSSPSCNWSTVGQPYTDAQGFNSTQIYYAIGCSGSNTLAITVTTSGSDNGDTYMIYDVTSPNSWTFDKDSGGKNGNQNTIASSLTTCSGCLTPTASSTGIAFGNFGEDSCTATGLTGSSPSGAIFDSATYTGNSVNGQQNVDENNGWMHYPYASSSGAITTTYSESCAIAQGYWAGRVAAFKAAGSSDQPLPPTGLTAVVQ